MRQLLLRVPDDLHARLTERARRSGRSANAIATDILEREVSDESGDARATLRAKARRLGLLASSPAGAGADVRAVDWDDLAERTRGLGQVADRLLAEGR